MSQTLIAALQNPALYPHPVERFEVIETHISWVLLTGPYAYKIKKPMDFGFLDFTSLDKRRFYCNEELRLNQRLTDDLYLEVLPITGSEEAPRIGGDGEAIEYLLKMRQFPQDNLLAAIQGRGELSNQHIDELAEQIAHFHQNTPKVPLEHPLGTAESCMAPVRQNFEQVRPLLKDKADLQQLDALEAWAESSFERLLPVLQERKAKGFIRECHGDIHLGNAALIDGRVVLFDCIEFNEPFRFTDVCADFAFLAMDLEDRGLKCHARRFVSLYLEHTGDYQALELLNFYKAYRAMVRAKVALFSLGYQTDAVQRAATLRQYRNYANLAESYSAIPSRFLAVTHGVSAVGKSQVAMRLVEALGAVRLRSDVERKRLFGEQPEHDRGQFAAGIYSSQASEATYAPSPVGREDPPGRLSGGDRRRLPEAESAPGRLPHRGRNRRAVPDPRLPGARSGDRRLACATPGGRQGPVRRDSRRDPHPAGYPRAADSGGDGPEQARRHPRRGQPRRAGRRHSPAPARSLNELPCRPPLQGGRRAAALLYSRRAFCAGRRP